MSFNKSINLFEITDAVINRFREESGYLLTGYEFQFKFKRDWNCPINRININIWIYGIDIAQTVFDEKYDTEKKVVDYLFGSIRDDGEFDNLKEGLFMTKMHSLELRTEKLSKQIKRIYKESGLIDKEGDLFAMVDEKDACKYFYDNGFPVMQYQISNKSKSIKRYYDLDFNMRNFNEKSIFEEIEHEIKTHNKV
jgi:hypothetical protein